MNKRPFRASFGEAMDKMSDVASIFARLTSQDDARACVKLLDEISLLMAEATQSIEKATMNLERAAGYAPYRERKAA